MRPFYLAFRDFSWIISVKYCSFSAKQTMHYYLSFEMPNTNRSAYQLNENCAATHKASFTWALPLNTAVFHFFTVRSSGKPMPTMYLFNLVLVDILLHFCQSRHWGMSKKSLEKWRHVRVKATKQWDLRLDYIRNPGKASRTVIYIILHRNTAKFSGHQLISEGIKGIKN